MRSKIFRQVVQINQGKADALPRFFGQADGIIFKQAARLELCGVAFTQQQNPRRNASGSFFSDYDVLLSMLSLICLNETPYFSAISFA